MVSQRCKMMVKEELNKLGFQCVNVELGMVEIRENISHNQHDLLKRNLLKSGLELLDDKNQVIKTENNVMKLFYPDLLPGNYQIRVKIDENNDGKWALGDKKLKNLPEKLYVYPKIVNVRANWEIEDIDLVF